MIDKKDQHFPRCMFSGCYKTFDISFVKNTFSKTFHNRVVKDIYTNILFKEENKLFVSSQHLVINKQYDNDKEQLNEEHYKRLLIISDTFLNSCIETSSRYEPDQEDIKELYFFANKQDHALHREVHEYVTNRGTFSSTVSPIFLYKNILGEDLYKLFIIFLIQWRKEIDLYEFKKKIILQEKIKKLQCNTRCKNTDCTGFLNINNFCKTCNFFTCGECEENYNNKHVCNKDLIKTLDNIKKTTKKCPGCNTYTIKSEGCDQMFCTYCKTGWDWESGKLEQNVHNPHFFDYVRSLEINNMERNLQEVRCGREINEDLCLKSILLMVELKYNATLTTLYCNTVKSLVFLETKTIQRQVDRGNIINNTEHRVQYLMNEITEKQFKVILYKNYTRYLFNKEMKEIMYMFKQTAIEILYKIKELLKKHSDISMISGSDNRINETDNLKTFSHEVTRCLLEILYIRNHANENLVILLDKYDLKNNNFYTIDKWCGSNGVALFESLSKLLIRLGENYFAPKYIN
jgi:hypothetical protein